LINYLITLTSLNESLAWLSKFTEPPHQHHKCDLSDQKFWEIEDCSDRDNEILSNEERPCKKNILKNLYSRYRW